MSRLNQFHLGLNVYADYCVTTRRACKATRPDVTLLKDTRLLR